MVFAIFFFSLFPFLPITILVSSVSVSSRAVRMFYGRILIAAHVPSRIPLFGPAPYRSFMQVKVQLQVFTKWSLGWRVMLMESCSLRAITWHYVARVIPFRASRSNYRKNRLLYCYRPNPIFHCWPKFSTILRAYSHESHLNSTYLIWFICCVVNDHF